MLDFLPAIRRFVPLAATAALACSAPGVGGKPHQAAAATAPSADPALWALSDDDTTLYFFGSMHMLKPGTVWFDDEVKAAFDRSDTLVLEVAATSPSDMAATVAKLALNTNDPPTSEALAPRDRANYLAALERFDIPAAAMDRVDPWLAAINLSVAPLVMLGYRDDIGVEKVLESSARASSKQVIGLETAEQQLGYFDTLPRKVQLAYLNATVKELPKVEKEFRALSANWARGRADALGRQMNESIRDTPELAKVLLYDRNVRWVGWIERRLEQPGTVFIAVGAGHLAGKGSVIDLLQGRKYHVRRLGKKDFGLK